MEASAIETICYLISLTVVGLCIIMKVPQLWSAFKAGDTKGISVGSVLLEQCGYSIMLSYSFAMEYPVANYLETAFLLIQNFFLIGYIIHTRDMLSPKVFIAFVLYMIVYLSIANKLLPDAIMKTVISFNTPLSVSSKLTQIFALCKSKDPGRLSAKTWGIAGYGCYARIFTNLALTGDPFIIFGYSCSAFLNTVMVVMILYYTQQRKTKLY